MYFLKITRPANCIFVMLCVYFGAVVSSSIVFNWQILFAMLSATFIAAAGYVVNDFFDLPIDIINRPDRVLPSGKISPAVAYIYSILLFIAGIIFSYFTGHLACVILAFVNSLALFYYAKTFKSSFLMGNILVAYASASTFIFGGIVTNNINNSMTVAIFALIYTMIRELVKDIEDIPGDKKLGAKTYAVIMGTKSTLLLVAFFAVLMASFLIYNFVVHSVKIRSLILMITTVIIPLSYLIFEMFKRLEQSNFRSIQRFMKIDMLIILLILWMDII